MGTALDEEEIVKRGRGEKVSCFRRAVADSKRAFTPRERINGLVLHGMA